MRFCQMIGVEKVFDTNSDPRSLVSIRRSNTAFGGAELRVAATCLSQLVEDLVVRQHQMRLRTDQQTTAADALPLEHVDLRQQHMGIDDDPVANHRSDVVVQDPARDQLELERLPINHKGVASIVATLVAHDVRAFLRHNVDDSAFAFVAPLGPDDY